MDWRKWVRSILEVKSLSADPVYINKISISGPVLWLIREIEMLLVSGETIMITIGGVFLDRSP